MIDKSEIFGIKRFTSKDGKPTIIVYVLSDLSVYDVQYGCAGRKVQEIFIPEQFHALFKDDSVIGKFLLRHYVLDGDKAVVSKFEVAKM